MICLIFIQVACNSTQETSEILPQPTLEPDIKSIDPKLTDSELSFVKNDRCIECHARQTAEWLGSDHEQAMQIATDETVLGDFEEASFSEFGVTSRFFKREGKFFVNTVGSDGELADFQVTYTFGITPLQQYLLELPNGKLQAFTISWDTINQRWFTLYPDEKITPQDRFHWTQRVFTWNSSCAECHSTNLNLNYDLETDHYQTSWSEINVSCQACHGPGSQHVEWAANPESTDKGLLINYKALNSKDLVDNCARCHSRRYPISPADAHGRPFLDDFMIELLYDALYYPDGQILDEVYVYGSFTQSKMYQQGVSCLDCHNPHSLKLRRSGNDLCTACHQSDPPTILYKTLSAKDYDTPAHHFHEPNSVGAQCVNCHMPAKTYMVVDPRRDHRFGSPRPDISIKFDTPNACNQCHDDKSSQWAMDTMTQWYGEVWQTRPSFAEIFSLGRAGLIAAAEPLITLAQDRNQSPIVRATALDLLRYQGDAGIDVMQVALNDPSPLVRVMAVRGIELLPLEQRVELIFSLLSDPIRAVRIEAARVIFPGAAMLSETQRPIFEEALTEYKEAQLAQADHPQGHANLAQLYTIQGDLKQAEEAYKTAIKQGPHFFPAYNNLAHLYYQQGKIEAAENSFRQAIEFTPDEGMLYYSLALLLVEQGDLVEARETMEQATKLMADNARVHYNYGLLLQRLEQFTEAEKAFMEAYQLTPEDPELLYAIISFYKNQGQWNLARDYAQQLTELYPDVSEFKELFESISQVVR